MRRLIPWKDALVSIASLVSLGILFWFGLHAGYVQDDFAWLNLNSRLLQGDGLSTLLFAPMAQGTVRTLSERLPYLLSAHFFGFDPLPMRILWAVLSLLNVWIWVKLLRLPLPSALLCIAIWYLNPALEKAQLWPAALNQTMQALAIGLALWLHDRPKWLLPVFCLSLLVHELCLLIPFYLLAMDGWPILRKAYWRVMAGISILFFLGHRWAGRSLANHTYQISLGPQEWLHNLLHYFQLATPQSWLFWLAFLGLAALACWPSRIRLTALPFALLSTVLVYCSLPNIQNGYYLFVPLAGCVLLLALVFRKAAEQSESLGAVALGLGLLLLSAELRVSYPKLQKNVAESTRFRSVIELASQQAQLDPERPVVVSGLSMGLYSLGWRDSPFRVIGVRNVYLAPEESRAISDSFEVLWHRQHFLDWKQIDRLRQSRQARFVHLDPRGIRLLQNEEVDAIAKLDHEKSFAIRRPGLHFDPPESGDRGWLKAENGMRWMEPSFSVALEADGGDQVGITLFTIGTCELSLRNAGVDIGEFTLTPGWKRYDLQSPQRINPATPLEGQTTSGCRIAVESVVLAAHSE
ncbi:hypothetical protein [Bryobacter aggregatus]|uniref:hypothetical protein n=1 Tax=Bryobacter aggregatus TaxID=360054 RepID=UPI0004E103F1|nr:hypothetical protein [Bryobacter aggregatus]